MKRYVAFIGAMALGIAIEGPSLSAATPPPSRGTVAIEPQTADGEYDPSLRIFADVVSKALTARGFTVFDDPAHAAYRDEMILSRTDVGTGFGKDPNAAKASIGAGLVVPMPTGSSNVVALRRTELRFRLRARNGEVVWDGAAVTVRAADTRKGTDEAVAADLSDALLRAYPARLQGVIGVP